MTRYRHPLDHQGERRPPFRRPQGSSPRPPAKPPTGGGGSGKRGPAPFDARAVLSHQLTQVTNAMMAKGVPYAQASHYARIILSRPEVTIGPKFINWQGRRFSPTGIASSRLADWITGEAASQRNQQALLGDPTYQAQVADAAYQQQLATAGLGDAQRRAIIDFGDPRYASALGDPTLAGQAAENPFSIAQGLARQAAQEHAAALASANQHGTLFGGGAQAGQELADRNQAARLSEGTRSLEDVLQGITRQQIAAQGAYDFTKNQALQDTQARLTESGVLSPQSAPSLYSGRFRFHNPRNPRGRQVSL